MAVWPNGSKSIPRVTSEFNPARRNPVTGVVQPHNGIDLVGWSTVVSPVNGTIIYAGYNGTAGNEVRIKGDDGTIFRLLHNSRFLRTGGRVSEGEGVAIMGTTGQSTGVHCHFETKPNNVPVNPRTYMAGKTGGSSGGTANVGAGQRTAKVVIKRRSQPTSKSSEAGEPLQPGTVGNFTGWIRGENVEGNNVWYKGISGHWFWSGGFHEGANGSGLKDLNPSTPKPTPVASNQRKAGGNGVNGRKEPNTNGGVTQTLAPGVVGDFNGWAKGQTVEGNNVWFRGAHSGDWFWSGGFEGGANTSGLTDLNPSQAPTSPADGLKANQRKVKSGNSVNGRSQPNTGVPIVQELAAGTVADFKGWVKGQSVEGNDTWFVGAYAGNFFWSGGFEGGANKNGLSELSSTTPPPTTTPTPPVNNTGAKQQKPVLPFAKEGWDTPRGRDKREAKPGKGIIIDGLAVHHTGTTNDNYGYFKGSGDGSVPTWYVRGADIFEFTRPGLRPVTTASNNNWTVSIETQNTTGAPEWAVSAASLESIAQIAAWLASYDGKTLDGIKVEFKLNRDYIKGHKEFSGNSTSCPGPYLYPRLDEIVARAKVIYAEKYSGGTPVTPPKEEPAEETVSVPKSLWDKLKEITDKLFNRS